MYNSTNQKPEKMELEDHPKCEKKWETAFNQKVSGNTGQMIEKAFNEKFSSRVQTTTSVKFCFLSCVKNVGNFFKEKACQVMINERPRPMSDQNWSQRSAFGFYKIKDFR